MTDILTSITSLAVSVYRERATESYAPSGWFQLMAPADPVLGQAHDASVIIPERHPAIADVTRQVFAEPDLAHLASSDQLDPMVLHAGGGGRMSPEALVTGLLSAAFLQIHYLRLPLEETTFVRAVLEGFEELRRAARGERIRTYLISGVAGVKVPEGRQISTPWGVLRPAPHTDVSAGPFSFFAPPSATCLLAHPQLLSVVFDRAPQPDHTFDTSERPSESSSVLLPLAFALASADDAEPIVPVFTWSTLVLPFQGGIGYSFPLRLPSPKPQVDVGDLVTEIEGWSRIVHDSHTSSVDIAAGRLASAVAYRWDKADALIDAVMVWENLVGTGSEVAFRVTAALAKMLESDHTKRRVLRKSLADLYGVRSRVVHGEAVDQTVVDSAATEAIAIAAQALRACYRRGHDWLALTSNARADSLLLDEP